ncbi:MAG: M14 family metallocarboxypeptidase [Pseudomonadota bacterium]
MQRFYPIGTPGTPWGDSERRAWFEAQRPARSYHEQVLARLQLKLPSNFTITQYGALPVDPQRYPLFALSADGAGSSAPWVLITGGVHGYETSGVQGALDFVHGRAQDYLDRVNFLVLPCVSPWGYEMITRWNPNAVDPNRSFKADSPAEEAASAMALLEERQLRFLMHIDLHETTDSDEDEFRPALAARDGEAFKPGTIPDGFYTVGDRDRKVLPFQQAIIEAVAQVTHIADADADGTLIGTAADAPGIIHIPSSRLGLCAGVTGAPYTSTTEVYPDSARVTDEQCNAAQVAATCGALDYALQHPPAAPH